jgi:hypothetical protein
MKTARLEFIDDANAAIEALGRILDGGYSVQLRSSKNTKLLRDSCMDALSILTMARLEVGQQVAHE